MGIHRLLLSCYCLLNTNTAITRQLIRTARTLEAEWWQVCWEAWVRGQRKMSRVLGAFGLLDFAMLRPVIVWRAFWNLRTIYFFNFRFFFSGCGEPRVTETADTESANSGVHLYLIDSLGSIQRSRHKLKFFGMVFVSLQICKEPIEGTQNRERERAVFFCCLAHRFVLTL